MAAFAYKAMDANGKSKNGVLEGDNHLKLSKLLSKRKKIKPRSHCLKLKFQLVNLPY
jgi:type II secretory pathway component PulF